MHSFQSQVPPSLCQMDTPPPPPLPAGWTSQRLHASGEMVPNPFPRECPWHLGTLHLYSNLLLPLGEARVSPTTNPDSGKDAMKSLFTGVQCRLSNLPWEKCLTGLSIRSSCADSRPLTLQTSTKYLLHARHGTKCRVYRHMISKVQRCSPAPTVDSKIDALTPWLRAVRHTYSDVDQVLSERSWTPHAV